MTARPLISVVTPFYQVGDYLAESIECVRAQSFEDWELILVDDGSTDDGPRIARTHAASDPGRITVLQHAGRANRGASASRNLGAAVARGTWIAYLDADDVWVPDKLAQQVTIVEAHPNVGLIMGATLYWHSWVGDGGRPDRLVPVGAPPDRVHPPPSLLGRLYPLGDGAAPSMNTVLVRADILRQVGGWEDAFPTAYDDQALLAKLYLATPAYVSSACWDRYRQRPRSTMTLELRGSAYHVHRRRFLDWFEGYLRGRGGPEDRHAAIRARVHAAGWRYRHPALHLFGRAWRRGLRLMGR